MWHLPSRVGRRIKMLCGVSGLVQRYQCGKGGRSLRGERFYSHHAIAHSFVENPLRLQFFLKQAYARATGRRSMALDPQVKRASEHPV